MAEDSFAAPNSEPSPASDHRGRLAISLLKLAGAIVLFLSFRWLLFEPYVIPSGSMIPTLLVHDHIVVNKFVYGIRWPFSKTWFVRFATPRRGDVVVFRSVEDDGFYMVKRLIGVPGDRIAYSEKGDLIINGQPVPKTPIAFENQGSDFYKVDEVDINAGANRFDFFLESLREGDGHRIIEGRGELRWGQEELVVPEGQYFLMGDNRDHSRDSRAWGLLPENHLLGRASFVWLSCQDTLPNAPYLCNPSTIRWRRFFTSVR